MIKLYESDGFYEVNLLNYGLDFMSFDIEPLTANHGLESYDGVDGEFIQNSDLNSRRIEARLMYETKSYDDFHANKSRVYKLFNPANYLYAIDEREPHKRWKVKVESMSEISNKESRIADEIQITFVSESPYAKSVKETETIIATNEGYLSNNGDIYLDAREHIVQIHFYGESENLRIVNETTNTQFQYFDNTTLQDEFYIDSLYAYKNNILVSKDTNHGALEFAKGSNLIRVYGAVGDWSLIIEHHDLYV